MARRGGIRRISAGIYDSIREVIKTRLREVSAWVIRSFVFCSYRIDLSYYLANCWYEQRRQPVLGFLLAKLVNRILQTKDDYGV